MKNSTTIVLALIVFFKAGDTFGATYYKFQGLATYVQDSANITSFNQGDQLTYTFLVNFDITGTNTEGSGIVREYNRNYMGNEYFFTDYLSGSAPQNYVEPISANSILEFNVGNNGTCNSTSDEEYGFLYGSGNALNTIYIQKCGLNVRNWDVGTQVIVDQNEWKFSGETAHISGDLTLIEISKTRYPLIPDVPLIPGVFHLLLNNELQ